MKRLLIIVSALLLSSASFAQQPDSLYIKKMPVAVSAHIPEALKYLPNPPAEGTPEFLTDSVLYFRGKALRDSERGQIAIKDTKISVDYYMERFGEAMGVEMTPETFPVVKDYILTTFLFARASIMTAKSAFARHRPYQHFSETTPTPEDEAADDYTSYPSGHTVRAWVLALAMTAIDPYNQEAILKTGLDMGESRIITGYHYRSDVDAARVCAAGSFASLVSDPTYLDLMARAREELASARANQ